MVQGFLRGESCGPKVQAGIWGPPSQTLTWSCMASGLLQGDLHAEGREKGWVMEGPEGHTEERRGGEGHQGASMAIKGI